MAVSRARVIGPDQAREAPSLGGQSQDERTTRPVARVASASLMAAHDEAEAVLARAHREAERLVEQARESARGARDEAEREGRQQAEASLAAAWLKLRQREHEALERQREHALSLARLLAERLLGRALELDPSLIADLGREALRSVSRARRVALFVHPDDEAPLRARLGELGLSAPVLEVHVDPTRPRGSVLADTDVGAVDAQLAPQLDRLVAALRAPSGR